MFLVLNTSGLTLIPVSIMVYRAQMGAAQPTDIFIPILLATFFSTLAGIIITSLFQRINLLNRTILLTLGGACAVVAAGFSQMSPDTMNKVSTTTANILLMTIITGFILAGVRKKVNVYDAFIEGAKDGFTTAVRIIPYLVAILVGIGVFRASGAMDMLIGGMRWCVEVTGANAEWVDAMPTALMKPLSGSGARGMMVDAMTTYGADSFVGRLSCVFQGSTDTTFYILAVYFGSVGVSRTRHAVTCGLLADFAGLFILCIDYGKHEISGQRYGHLRTLEHRRQVPQLPVSTVIYLLHASRNGRLWHQHQYLCLCGADTGDIDLWYGDILVPLCQRREEQARHCVLYGNGCSRFIDCSLFAVTVRTDYTYQ